MPEAQRPKAVITDFKPKQPAMTPAQKQEVVTGMTEGEKRLLKAEKSASFARGALLAAAILLPLVPAAAAGGWYAYDQTVKNTSDTLSDITIRGDIARRVADGAR